MNYQTRIQELENLVNNRVSRVLLDQITIKANLIALRVERLADYPNNDLLRIILIDIESVNQLSKIFRLSVLTS